MMDAAVAPDPHVERRPFLALRAQRPVVACEIVADRLEELQVAPTALARGRKLARNRGTAEDGKADALRDGAHGPSNASRNAVHIGQGRGRCGPNIQV